MATSKPKDYVNNASLLREVIRSKKIQSLLPEDERESRAHECLTPELMAMLIQLVIKYASSYRWRGYTWNEDMQSEAIGTLYKVALKFNLEKAGEYPNPFGYYTQTARRAFLSYIDKQKQQGRIRDAIIEMSDTELLPSYGRQYENVTDQSGMDLDGTKAIKSDPMLRRRRRKKPKVNKADDTRSMTDPEYKIWLDKKVAEFKEKG